MTAGPAGAAPRAMRQVVVAAPGGPEAMRVEDGPVPAAGPGEVLIRVLAAGVNRPDVAQRQGAYPPPPGASPILGLEVAGEVVALGEGAAGWRVGDRVCALVNGGGYAEFCVAPAGQCLAWPDGYDAVRAAALPENCFTVWANLFDIGGLRAGQVALVHGGSSGIGITAIQLGVELGAQVLVTAGSAEKCAACERLGAALAVNYREADFVDAVRGHTGGRGVDVVLDMVAGDYTAGNLRCLASGRAAGADRVPARGGGGEARPDGDPDAAARGDGVDDAAAHGGGEGGDRGEPAGAGVAGAVGGAVRAGDRAGVRAGRGGGGARADGEQCAHREDRAAGCFVRKQGQGRCPPCLKPGTPPKARPCLTKSGPGRLALAGSRGRAPGLAFF